MPLALHLSVLFIAQEIKKKNNKISTKVIHNLQSIQVWQKYIGKVLKNQTNIFHLLSAKNVNLTNIHNIRSDKRCKIVAGFMRKKYR